MRRRNPARVLGPYQERGRWRLVVVEEGGRRSVFFPTYAEAQKFKLGAEREIAQPASQRIADMLMEWHTQKVRAGLAQPKTVAQQLGRLQSFFAPVADQDIAALTPRRAAALYLEATQRVSAKTGTVLAAASHRLDLWAARTFYRWAVRQGHVGASPFREVKPVGRVNVGKPQLRIEEARRFTRAALSYFEERQHPLAIGALLALTMGLRTGEVLERVVRDLDDGSRYLWIDAGKTANARRRLEVPEVMQPYLIQLAANKNPDERLFGTSRTGERHANQMMWEMVQRLCTRAGVPVVRTRCGACGLHWLWSREPRRMR